jgi:hypothetical protein
MTTEEAVVRRIVMMLTLSCLASGALVGSALAAGKTGTFAGKTAQHRNIKLKVSAGQVKLLNFSIELKCRDGSVLVDTESGFQATKLSGGKFSDSQVGSTDTVTYSGKVSGSKATGTVKVTDKLGKVKCNSPKVKFTVHRG